MRLNDLTNNNENESARSLWRYLMKNVLTIPHLAEKKNNKNLPSAVQA